MNQFCQIKNNNNSYFVHHMRKAKPCVSLNNTSMRWKRSIEDDNLEVLQNLSVAIVRKQFYQKLRVNIFSRVSMTEITTRESLICFPWFVPYLMFNLSIRDEMSTTHNSQSSTVIEGGIIS
ncbi:CLUMA_CG018334, isoform A [Clunio marinus]|uniref:CLUMA_CG018334, isoform A n=1 Tax=Clunio marinus TaxID=568069 RepID=A0A1J1J3H2_9DIPT|nr:CLUMA_CG018334, isoform A [Clunio marinus]